MATRQSIDMCLQQCEETLQYAEEQYNEGAKQEHYEDDAYIQSQALIQTALNEIETLYASSNGQQKEQLYRMRLQLQQQQNQMILLDH